MPTSPLTDVINNNLPDTPPTPITPATVRSVLRELLPKSRTGTVVTFDRNADYEPLPNNTFTVDTTTTPIFPGVVVFVYLGGGPTLPNLPVSLFELVGGVFRVNVPLMLAFRVRSATKIQYTITQLPT